jgi:spermidine synthase
MASIDVSETGGVRYLHFGSRWVQGAMRIGRPWALELEYTRELMFALLLRDGGPEGRRWPRTVLHIGLGAASLPRFFHRHRPHAAQTIVEIDPAVINVAQQVFKLPPEGPRLRIEIGDGVDYVISSERSFDLIVVDGFDAKGRAGALDTLPFYCDCLARLSERGVLAVNLLTYPFGVRGSVDRLRRGFDGRVLALPKCGSGNVAALGAGGDAIDRSQEDLAAAAKTLRSETGLNLQPTLKRLREHAGSDDARIKL